MDVWFATFLFICFVGLVGFWAGYKDRQQKKHID